MLPLRIQGTRSSITVSLVVRTLLQLSNKSLMILGLIRKMSKAKQITCGGEGRGSSQEKLDMWTLCSVMVIKKGRGDI